MKIDGFHVSLNLRGLNRWEKLSYPARFGLLHEVSGNGFTVRFNMRGEVTHFRAEDDSWPHPHDWIRITPSGKRIYMSAGSYIDPVSLYGEYFIPVPEERTNSLFPANPFSMPGVRHAARNLDRWLDRLTGIKNPPGSLAGFLDSVRRSRRTAGERSAEFKRAIKGAVPVLPPDARHVQYDLLPVIISDGCLHNCGFCTIKTGNDFRERRTDEIKGQLDSTRQWLGQDIRNVNALFLGQNDALACSGELILRAISLTRERLEISRSFMKEPRVFMFGSVTSLLEAENDLFRKMEATEFQWHINIGFESFHQTSLEMLKKPVAAREVKDAFSRAAEINRTFRHVEITGNIVLWEQLPDRHMQLAKETLADHAANSAGGRPLTIYLSPVTGHDLEGSGRIMKMAKEIQRGSPLPCFLYLLTGL